MNKIWKSGMSILMISVILFAFTGCGETADDSNKSYKNSQYQVTMTGYDIVGKEISLYVDYTYLGDDFGKPYHEVIPQAYQNGKLLYISETWPDNYMVMVRPNEAVTITFHFILINKTTDVKFKLFKGYYFNDARRTKILKGEVDPILGERYQISQYNAQ